MDGKASKAINETENLPDYVDIAGHSVPREIANMLSIAQKEGEAFRKRNKVLKRKNEKLKAENKVLLKRDNEIENKKLKQENKALKREIRDLKRRIFGSRVEGLKTEQLSLFDSIEELDSSKEKTPDASGEKTITDTAERIRELSRELRRLKKKKSSERKSQVLANSDYKTVVEEPLEPEDKQCASCDGEKVKISDDETYCYVWVPGHLEKRVTKRPKYLCAQCRDYSDISQEPVPRTPILRSPAGASFLAKVFTDKFAYGLPFDRQSRMLQSIGIFISVATLCSYLKNIGWLFEAIAKEIKREVFASQVPQFDESRMKVRDLSLLKNIRRSTIWFYCGEPGSVFCQITDSNEGENAKKVFDKYKGYFQCDGATSFNCLESETRLRLGCWAHARRKFEKDSKEGDRRSFLALILIKKIYKLHELVAAGKVEFLEELNSTIEEFFDYARILKQKLSRNDLGYEGATYARNQESSLRRNFDRPEFRLDNNRVEQQVKTMGQGRRNFYFIGSPKMTGPTAGIYSLVLSALELKLNVYEYLEDVIENCHRIPNRELKNWTPIEWSKRRMKSIAATKLSTKPTLSTISSAT